MFRSFRIKHGCTHWYWYCSFLNFQAKQGSTVSSVGANSPNTFSEDSSVYQTSCSHCPQPQLQVANFNLAQFDRTRTQRIRHLPLCGWYKWFPHSALISQTPLLSIHSELVCGEMSVCCGSRRRDPVQCAAREGVRQQRKGREGGREGGDRRQEAGRWWHWVGLDRMTMR